MDTMMFSLPEIILSDMEEPEFTQSASRSSPRDLQPVLELGVLEHASALNSNLESGPCGSVPLEVASTLKHLDPPDAPDPDPIDLLSYRELLLELVTVIQQQLADMSAGVSDSVTPDPEEPAPAADPAPRGSRSDTSPNRDVQRTPPGTTSPGGGCTVGSPVVPSPADASPSPLDHDGCLFKDHVASQAYIVLAAAVASASEAETPGGAKPEEASTSLSDLGEAPLPGGPPAAESPKRLSVSGDDRDARTAAAEDPGDILPAGPPAPSVPALTSPMRETENMNSNSRPEATPESSDPDSSDPPADVVLTGQGGETERKEAMERQPATKAREEKSTEETSEREEEDNGDEETKARRRPSSQTENPEATPRDEPTTEGAEEEGACEEEEKQSERVGERRGKPEEEKQELEVKDPDASGGPGTGSGPRIEVPQEEREFAIPRRTRSTTIEEREQTTPPTPPPAATAGRRGRHSGPEIQDDGAPAGGRSLVESLRKRPKTSGCDWISTPTGSSGVKAADGKSLRAAGGREGTRRSKRKGRDPRFPTRLSTKLPTKYQDFILCNVKTSRGRKR